MIWNNIVDILPKNPAVPMEVRPLSAINGIAIHHSADEGTPQSWAEYQITPAARGGPSWAPDGCPSVCYHSAVMRDGTVFKMNKDASKTWHVANHNWHLIGIVLQGNLEQQPPSEAQMRSLLATVKAYRLAYLIQVENVRGHREWNEGSTECPGLILIPQFVRAALQVLGTN